jgi:hypothetical protein
MNINIINVYILYNNKLTMESRITLKTSKNINDLKMSVMNVISNAQFDSNSDICKLRQYVSQFSDNIFEKTDFAKHARIKSTVPSNNQCLAKKATLEQCTRRRKDGFSYCGTHIKGQPHGTMNLDVQNNVVPNTHVSVTIVAKEINGIMFYLDDYGNVYLTEDICNNIKNPSIIAKYTKCGDIYHIPSLNISSNELIEPAPQSQTYIPISPVV